MKIIITSGGTSEKIDQVRKITNMSTGQLGIEIVKQLYQEHEIYFITSEHCLKPKETENLKVIISNSTEEVSETLEILLKNLSIDFVIHTMAISDYTVDYVLNTEEMIKDLTNLLKDNNDKLEELLKHYFNKPISTINNDSKISSSNENMLLGLKKTQKIINRIKEWSPKTKLIGFKLLSGVSKEELIHVANVLKRSTKADYVIANDLSDIRNGEHIAYLVSDEKIETPISEEVFGYKYSKMVSKEEIANCIKKIIK